MSHSRPTFPVAAKPGLGARLQRACGSCAYVALVAMLVTPVAAFAAAPVPMPGATSARGMSGKNAPFVAAPSQRVAIVRGIVVDQDGRALAGARVTAEPFHAGSRLQGLAAGPGGQSITSTGRSGSQSQAVTDESGAFVHPDLWANLEYRLRIEKDGYIPRELRVTFRVATNEIDMITLVSGDVERARAAYEGGYEAYSAGDYVAAVAPMEEVVAVYGDSDSSDEMLVVALGVLGQIYLQQNRADEAEARLERLLAIRPDNAIALRGLGQVAMMRSDAATAIERFELAVQVEPDNANGRFLLGYTLHLSGNPGDAIAHLEACLQVQPGFARAHKRLGLALADIWETERAIEHLEAYLRAAPDAPDAAEVRAKIEEIRALV